MIAWLASKLTRVGLEPRDPPFLVGIFRTARRGPHPPKRLILTAFLPRAENTMLAWKEIEESGALVGVVVVGLWDDYEA